MPNNHQHLLSTIETLAGDLRAKTFRAAAEFVLQHDNRPIIECGCFRGEVSEGQSTLILGLLASAMNTQLISVDWNNDNIEKARAAVKHLPHVTFRLCDSVRFLSAERQLPVLLYLDSYDYSKENPLPCQIHQACEVGAAYGKLVRPCCVLLDDHITGTGGKTLLSSMFLKERGWRLAAEGYQLLYVLE